jgi:hypothetical protein
VEHAVKRPLPEGDSTRRIPGLKSREEFLALVELELEAFNSLRRRDQLPQRPPYELSEEMADARGWPTTSALALVIALELADRYDLSRNRAAEIAGPVYAVENRWADISRTSQQLADGTQPEFHVLFAALDVPGVKPTKKVPFPTIAVGTLSEIAAGYPTAAGIISVSVTRCAALMRQRAARAKIDLSEFWESFR